MPRQRYRFPTLPYAPSQQWHRRILYDGSLKDISKIFDRFNRLPENTIDEINYKRKEYEKMTSGSNWMRLKTLADIQVAQFFIPKDEINVRKIITDEEYMDYLSGTKAVHPMKAGKAGGVGAEKRFFHYFLEFPEVFAEGGFDCILGNPPFLGKTALTGTFGHNYCEWLKHKYRPIGSCDLVVYFLRRVFSLIKTNRFISLITTNSISDGASREGGLEIILSKGGELNFIQKSTKWPGLANVYISLVTIHNGRWEGKRILDGKAVPYISSYFEDYMEIGNPHKIATPGKIYEGYHILGDGFILKMMKFKSYCSYPPNMEM